MDHLADMALFVEVAQAKGFRSAAERLNMPNSTLSRRISALEKSLSLRLFNRTTRRVELTEAGQIYFERAKRIVEEARLAHEQLGDLLAQPSGVLRVSLPVDFGITYLAPLIAEFARTYPGISFEIDMTPRRIDLVAEPFDVAIRVGVPADSGLIARPLAHLRPHLYAAPAYLREHGIPERPEDLTAHECMGLVKSGRWTLESAEREAVVALDSRFAINSVGMIRRLATLDMGIILVPEEIVADDLDQGRLARILPEWEGKGMPIYALTETRLLPAKTQRFIDFLKDRLATRR